MEHLKKTKLSHDIASLPDHVVGRAEFLKDYFDRNAYELLEECINPLIDLLRSEDAASLLGAKGFSILSQGSIQQQLEGLKRLIDEAQWGVPDSVGTAVIQNGAITDEKLSEALNQLLAQMEQRLDRVSNTMECRYIDGNFTVSGELPQGRCAVRFLAPSDYVKGAGVVIGGEEYDVIFPNGKGLPDRAWITGATVILQIDPDTRKAFFNAGGADLSFITATADKIIEGYTGCDVEGEPVSGNAIGWLTEKVTGKISFTSNSTSSNPFRVPFERKPKAAILFATTRSQFANASYLNMHMVPDGYTYCYGGRMLWIDGYLQTATESKEYFCTITAVTDSGIECNLDAYNRQAQNFTVYYELYY